MSESKQISVVQEFERRFVPVPEAGCWLWIGDSTSGTHRYGVMRVFGKRERAHRVSWRIRNGEIPFGLRVLHKCDTPECVNPDHLFIGTQQENVDDMNRKRRGMSGITNRTKTHCKHGHDLSDAYLIAGRRRCRKCNTVRCVNSVRKRRMK